MPHTTIATIDLAAIRHNLQQVRLLAPNAHIMAAVKADAYGHGLVEVARSLAAADGLAVARIDEALQLRAAGISQRLLVLSGVHDHDSLQHCARQQIDIVIHSLAGAELLLSCPLQQPLAVWLKHDSGMHRLGLNQQQLQQAEQQLRGSSKVHDIVLMSHFSSSEQHDRQNTEQQLAAFQATTKGLPHPCSLANSAAIIQHQASHQDWVRPGIMLYGANPLPAPIAAQFPVDLKPAMTLSSQVIAIRSVNKGQAVGYNSRWVAPRDSLIATLGIGYGDGYPRHAKNGTPVLINGQRATLTGTVSMDLIGVDITDIDPVNIGDPAILWGQGLAAEEIACCADTISYQLFTSITQRVARCYLNP